MTRWITAAAAASIATLTFIAFLPVLQNGFTNWDDPVNLLKNPNYRGLGWQQLAWMFTTFHNSLYRPIAWMTLGFDYTVWGMNPAGYHLTSLLFHSINAALFYFVAVKLLSTAKVAEPRRIAFAAIIAALVFAVHPLRVEAVASASSRSEVVAGFFFMLMLVCYLKAAADGSGYRRWMAGACFCYALCLLGKGAFLTVPFGLLILDYYPLQRSGRRAWLEKIPFFALAFVAGLLALQGKYESGLLYGMEQYTVFQRFALSAYGIFFYLWKTVAPIGLTNLYELPRVTAGLPAIFIVSAVAAAVLTLALIALRRRLPWAIAAWLWLVVMLAPTSNIMQNGPQLAADRYTYLPLLCAALLAGALLLRYRLAVVAAGAVLSVALLAGLSWKQAQVWRDSSTLWGHLLTHDPASSGEAYLAHYFRGSALLEQGKTDAALAEYEKSRDMNPRYASAYMSIAYVLGMRGDSAGAIENYRIALKLYPASAAAHFNLANQLLKRGESDEAIHHYAEAVRLKPDDAVAHNNLGFLLAAKGESANAEAHFKQAIRLAPDRPMTYYNLGRLAAARKEYSEAVGYFRTALKLDPNNAGIRETLRRVEERERQGDQGHSG